MKSRVAKIAGSVQEDSSEDNVQATSVARVRSQLRLFLYLISGVADFSTFVVVFMVSRQMAEAGADQVHLGIAGAGLSLTSGIGSLSGGWLSQRFDGRKVFITGASLICLSIAGCGIVDPGSPLFMACYWLIGIGMGWLYPPLIGWLNQGEDAHTNRQAVSRRLILFCVAWNVGMMCGQLTAGTLFDWGPDKAYLTSCLLALANVVLTTIAVRWVKPLPAVPIELTQQTAEKSELANAFKRLSWLANMGGMFGASLVLYLLPGFVVHIGISADDHGKLLAAWRVVIIATYLLMHNAGFWHFRFATSLATQILGACGLVVISQAGSDVTLFIGLAMFGQLIGFNYFSGLFYSTAGSSNEKRALAAGIHEATLAAGMSVGTLAGGKIGDLMGDREPYLFAAAIMLLLMIVQSAAWWRWVGSVRQNALH